MKLLIIKTKEIKDVPEGYGLRLIEQGKAIFAPKQKAEPKKAEDPKPKKG